MEKGINDLPVDIWILIFRRLSIKDLLKCRLVNKKFKNFSDFTDGINKLIIDEPHIYYDNCDGDYHWYYNNKLIDNKDIISLKCFRTIQKLSIFNLDKYLKYLKIYDQQLQLEELSNLVNLQSIEFGYPMLFNNNQQILNLNNLKIFVSNRCFIELDTPKLEKIRFSFINKIKLNSNPESIKHLIARNYDNEFEIFKNLEIMELRDNYKIINENLLSLFKNLKQLKFNNFGCSYLNGMKNSLFKILNDKIESKKEICFYLEGVKIENIDKFNEVVSIKYPYWKFRLNNYDLLDLNLPFINYLLYDRLEECVNNIKTDLPSSFFDKFFHINWIEVDSVKDIDGLNWFLNKLKYLNRLKIGFFISLDDVFYDNLPNTIKYLTILDWRDINYDFILKLSKLNSFYTLVNKDLFDLAFESFLNLKYLNTFTFCYGRKEIRIEKNGKYFYLNNGRELDYNQLIKECNRLRSK